jgi:hypothetical protein
VNGNSVIPDAVAEGRASVTDGATSSSQEDAGIKSGLTPRPPPEEAREPSFDEIAGVLFADRADPAALAVTTCPSSIPADARIRCLFDQRYRGDTKASSLAYELFVRWRIVAGVEVAHTMDGGYRGMIRLEPALPLVSERRHLEWIVAAVRDIDSFFSELGAHETTTAHPKRYRWKPLTLRFVRSVAARTPTAYAHDWTVVYNLAGSLNTSGDAVRETLVHEIFHLNDYDHPPPGGEAWSFGALGPIFETIVKKCGTSIQCLTPFTPNETIVRGGTYYSFQPGNGVREYAAELALRYYREQRAVLRSLPKVKAFKCGPSENARAWALMRDEFFEGIDVVPACGF